MYNPLIKTLKHNAMLHCERSDVFTVRGVPCMKLQISTLYTILPIFQAT